MSYPAKLSQTAIVECALTIIDAHGRSALGMRAVAEALGVRPASLYKHVGDLAGLESLLAESAATTLCADLDAALVEQERVGDADQSAAAVFMAAADAYVQFARRHPARYALLTAEAPSSPDAGIARKALWNRLLTIVGTRTGDADDTGAAVAVWSLLHGFVALEQSGLFGASGPHGALARGMDALARGFSAPQE